MVRRPRDLTPYASLVDFFGAELRKMRTDAGLSQPQLAEALGCTATWIGKIELGECPPSEASAQDFDTYFKTNGYFWRLWRLIKEAGKHLALPPGFWGFMEREARATSIRGFVAQVVPGLLQNESYARGVISAGQTRDAVDDLVCARLARQQILNRDNPPLLRFVLDESVLRRPIGGHEVMREQLTRLHDLMLNSPNIQIRVLPFASVIWPALAGSFTLLGFADEPDIAYLNAPGAGLMVDDRDRVDQYALQFDLVLGEALPSSGSLKMIARALEDYT
jgi:transcriptional regulator with XRE-family HTH domain